MDIKNRKKKTAEMLLADPENARRLELAKSRSIQKKRVSTLNFIKTSFKRQKL